MGLSSSANSNMQKNSLRSKSLSDRISRPEKLRIAKSSSNLMKKFFCIAWKLRVCCRAGSLPDFPHHMELEIAWQEVAVGKIDHFPAGREQAGSEQQEHIASLYLERTGDLRRGSHGLDLGDRIGQDRVAALEQQIQHRAGEAFTQVGRVEHIFRQDIDQVG